MQAKAANAIVISSLIWLLCRKDAQSDSDRVHPAAANDVDFRNSARPPLGWNTLFFLIWSFVVVANSDAVYLNHEERVIAVVGLRRESHAIQFSDSFEY